MEPEVILTEKIKNEDTNLMAKNEKIQEQNLTDIDEMLLDIQNFTYGNNSNDSSDNTSDSDNDFYDDDESESNSIIPTDQILSKTAEQICKNIEDRFSQTITTGLKLKKNSLEYFLEYFPDKCFEQLAEQTNKYATDQIMNKINEDYTALNSNANIDTKLNLDKNSKQYSNENLNLNKTENATKNENLNPNENQALNQKIKLVQSALDQTQLQLKSIPPNEFLQKLELSVNPQHIQKQQALLFKVTNVAEVKILIAIHLIMNILKYPRHSMYWSPLFYVKSIADHLSRDRFDELRKYFCIVRDRPKKTDLSSSVNGKRDHLWRIRPIVNSFVLKCQNLALASIDGSSNIPWVDEQMVPFLMYLNGTKIKTQRKVLRIFFSFVGLAVKNGWLEYKRDAEKICKNKQEIMDLLEFTLNTAEILFNQTNSNRLLVNRKRCASNSPPQILRTLLDNSSDQIGTAGKRNRLSLNRPGAETRYDGTDHWPFMDSKPQRCKMEGCDKKASVKCEKCNLHLCMSSSRNCFKLFHNKENFN